MPLLSRDELKNAVPCDAMGGVYLVGLGFPILPPPKLADLGEEYSYYYNARLYLSSLVHPGVVPPEDNYGLLLAMLPNLKDADNGRAEIYTAFIIWQYIEVNENKLLFTRGILFESVKSSYSAGSNLDLLDLACIVKADIPTVEISQVKRSPIYAECIRKGLDNWFN